MKISDNVGNMSNKIEEALRRKIKEEFVHGYIDENGVRQYPSIIALSKRHDVANVSLHRWSKKEDWQAEKNKVQTEYELAVQRERQQLMVQNGTLLDDRSINLAFGMMSDVARRLTEDQENRKTLNEILNIPSAQERDEQLKKFNTKHKILTAHDLNSIAGVVATAQKIGKLALGQAQEISKVSAHVTAPDSLRQVIADLDELAAAKSSTAKHTIQ